MVEKLDLLGHGVGPLQSPEMEAQKWVSQQVYSGTPLTRWTSEGRDWIRLMMQPNPRKEDVSRSLFESMQQAVKKKKESKGPVPTKQPIDLPPPTLEMKGNCKTTVGWVNSHAKMKARVSTVEAIKNFLKKWWGLGICLRQSTAERVIHTFREHNKEVDRWSGNGAKGTCVEEWVDTTRGLCGFWDGSCDIGNCGCGIILMAFSKVRTSTRE